MSVWVQRNAALARQAVKGKKLGGAPWGFVAASFAGRSRPVVASIYNATRPQAAKSISSQHILEALYSFLSMCCVEIGWLSSITHCLLEWIGEGRLHEQEPGAPGLIWQAARAPSETCLFAFHTFQATMRDYFLSLTSMLWPCQTMSKTLYLYSSKQSCLLLEPLPCRLSSC